MSSVEHKEEHQRHDEHHPLHHLHLISLLAYHLVALLAHGHPRVEEVGYTEEDTGKAQVIAYQPDVGVPLDDGGRRYSNHSSTGTSHHEAE